jgi:hypothetical protein
VQIDKTGLAGRGWCTVLALPARRPRVSAPICRRDGDAGGVPAPDVTVCLHGAQYFPFSLIDAMGTLEECRLQITRELRYQSSMDLEEATYAAIRHLPLAKVGLAHAVKRGHMSGYHH